MPHPMDAFFAPPDGRLFGCFPGAEVRPGQARMAALVFDAIQEGAERRAAWKEAGAEPDAKPDAVIQAVEAGTGTGNPCIQAIAKARCGGSSNDTYPCGACSWAARFQSSTRSPRPGCGIC